MYTQVEGGRTFLKENKKRKREKEMYTKVEGGRTILKENKKRKREKEMYTKVEGGRTFLKVHMQHGGPHTSASMDPHADQRNPDLL